MMYSMLQAFAHIQGSIVYKQAYIRSNSLYIIGNHIKDWLSGEDYCVNKQRISMWVPGKQDLCFSVLIQVFINEYVFHIYLFIYLFVLV